MRTLQVPVTRSLNLDPDLSQVALARALVGEVAREAGFPEERVFDITVASSEATANAIEHAGSTDQVVVTARLHADRLEIQIEGSGRFHPPSVASERSHRGLGLPLMASLSDRMALYSGPRGGTLVSLVFYRPDARDSDSLSTSIREILEENELAQLVSQNLPVGIYVLDPELHYRWANRAYYSFLDEPYRSSEVTGLLFCDVVPGAMEAGVRDDMLRVSQTGQGLLREDSRLEGYTRGPTWWRRHIFPLLGEGGAEPPYDLLVVVSEETGRNVAEQERQKLAEEIEALVEELAAANEELRTQYEELAAVNEDLRSQILEGPSSNGRSRRSGAGDSAPDEGSPEG